MVPEVIPRIFDPFFSTRFTGRGLGLSVLRGVLQGLGGSVEVHSEPGMGIAIQVYLSAMAQVGKTDAVD